MELKAWKGFELNLTRIPHNGFQIGNFQKTLTTFVKLTYDNLTDCCSDLIQLTARLIRMDTMLSLGKVQQKIKREFTFIV